MAGDKFKPVTFVKEIDGEEKERVAATPADAVRYRFNGWVEKGSGQATPKSTRASGSEAPGRDRPAAAGKSG